MEWNICTELQFHVIQTPTCFGFMDTFWNLFQTEQQQLNEKQLELAKLLCHLQAQKAVKMYQFVGIPPSIIAYCGVLNSLRVIGVEAKMNPEDELALTKEMLTFTDEIEISAICDILYIAADMEQWNILLKIPYEQEAVDCLNPETRKTTMQPPRSRRRLIHMVRNTLLPKRKSHRAK
jgi:hypothetical protein